MALLISCDCTNHNDDLIDSGDSRSLLHYSLYKDSGWRYQAFHIAKTQSNLIYQINCLMPELKSSFLCAYFFSKHLYTCQPVMACVSISNITLFN